MPFVHGRRLLNSKDLKEVNMIDMIYITAALSTIGSFILQVIDFIEERRRQEK